MVMLRMFTVQTFSIVAVLFISLISGSTALAAPVELSSTVSSYPLGRQLYYLKDSPGKLTITNVTASHYESLFIKSSNAIPNFGYTQAAYWVRIQLQNRDGANRWMLEVDYPTLDHIDVYLPCNKGGYQHQKSGDMYPLSIRKVKNQNFIFPLSLEPGKSCTIYLRFKTKSTMSLPINLWSEAAFHVKDRQSQHLIGMYIGLLLVMIIFNAVLFIFMRDLGFLYYVMYNGIFLLYQMAFKGLAFYYLWPSAPEWANTSLPFFAAFAVFWGVIFSRHYLLTKKHFPRLDIILKILAYTSLISSLLAFLLDYSISILIASVLGMASSVILIYTGGYVLSKGYIPAVYYLVAWVAFLGGVLLETIRGFGIIPSNFFTQNGSQLGSALQAIMLTLGLAARFNILRTENDAYREIEKELGVARRILRSILPISTPELPGLSIHITYLPMEEVGGDFYDFHQQREGCIGILLADVSGHGLPAALISSMVKISFSRQRLNVDRSDIILSNINSDVFGKVDDQFITAGYVYINAESGLLRYASAGHLPLIIYNRETGKLVKLNAPGKLLGVLPDINCGVVEYQLKPADRVLLYTDGVIECGNPQMELFGENRFLDFIRNRSELDSEAFSNALIQALRRWTGNMKGFDDDTALIVIDVLATKEEIDSESKKAE